MQKQTIKRLKVYIVSALLLSSSLYYYHFWLSKCWYANYEKILFCGSVFLFLISLSFNSLYHSETRKFAQGFFGEIEKIYWDNTRNIKKSVLVSIVMISTLSFAINLVDVFPRYVLKMLSEFYTHSLT